MVHSKANVKSSQGQEENGRVRAPGGQEQSYEKGGGKQGIRSQRCQISLIWKLTATPVKLPSMFVFLLEPGKLDIKFISFGRKK